MYSYCMGTSLDVISTIDIDYEAHSFKSKCYQRRKYSDMISIFEKSHNGLILAKDEKYNIIGFIYTRKLGILGLCGPMAVLPDHSSKGVATKLVLEAEKLLIKEKCTTIGFETTPFLMNFYLKRNWIANGITYFMSYHDSGLVDELNSEDNISFIKRTHNEVNSFSPFVRLHNGIDFTEEIVKDIEIKKALYFEIYVDSILNGLILFELLDDVVRVKLMNIKINGSQDFDIIKRILDYICLNYAKEIIFPINTQYQGLITSALQNKCKVKGYSIQFQSHGSDVIFCDSVFTSYHWGT